MIREGAILLTGGSGRLGTELRRLCPGIVAPPHASLDITDPKSVEATVAACRPSLIVHAAAYTNVAQAELERERCWSVNVLGTRNMVRAGVNASVPVVHISTDYVFEGTRGMYREDDTLGPVRNYYALTKLVAEEAVRAHPRHLVIRTSFRPRDWPHPVAFADVFTSQDYVDVIAPDILLAIQNFEQIRDTTLHIATERKTAYDLARRRRHDVRPGSKQAATVDLPDDISMNVERWHALRTELKRAEGC